MTGKRFGKSPKPNLVDVLIAKKQRAQPLPTPTVPVITPASEVSLKALVSDMLALRDSIEQLQAEFAFYKKDAVFSPKTMPKDMSAEFNQLEIQQVLLQERVKGIAKDIPTIEPIKDEMAAVKRTINDMITRQNQLAEVIYSQWNRRGSGISLIGRKSVRTATYVIAPSTAPSFVKEEADKTCDGTADDVEINDALATYRHVLCLQGTFYNDAEILIDDTMRPVFVGVGYNRTVLQAMTTGMNIIHINEAGSAVNYAQIGNFWLYGNNKAARGLYGEAVSRSYFEPIQATYCTTWGVDLKFNHSLTFPLLICNTNGTGSGTGGFHFGATDVDLNTLTILKLICEDNPGVGFHGQRGISASILQTLIEANGRQGGLIESTQTTRPTNIHFWNIHSETNNTSATAGLSDLDIEDGTGIYLHGFYFDTNANVDQNVNVKASGSGSRYFYLGYGSAAKGVVINSDESVVTAPLSSGGITFGTGVKQVYNSLEVMSAEFDLSGAATDVDLIHMYKGGSIISANVFYPEGSSADAGVVIRIGRYQDGVVLDDDYFLSKTSEVSKAKGFEHFYSGADFTNRVFSAGDTITVGTAGLKTGAGTVRIVVRYIQTGA